MMLLNFMHYLSRHSDDEYHFLVELQGEEDLERLRQQSGNRHRISRLPFMITTHSRMSAAGKLLSLYRKLFLHPPAFRKLGAEAIVILGGDDLSEYYKGWQVAADLVRIRQYSRKFPVILAGQTIGPFHGWRQSLARKCLRRADIWLRDPWSLHYCREILALPRIYEGADLALPDLPLSEQRDMGLRSEAEENRYVVLVPAGYYGLFTSDRTAYLGRWTEFIRLLHRREALQGMKFLMLPHVTRPEDDRLIIRDLLEKLDDEIKNRCIFDNCEYSAIQARTLIGKAYFTVSGRMHATISSLQQGKPAIPLSYSVKFDGVVGKALQQERLIADVSRGQDWISGKVTEIFAEKLSLLLGNYSDIKQEIRTIVSQQQEIALRQMDEIASQIQDQ